MLVIRIDEQLKRIENALNTALRECELLKREIIKREAEHPGQPVGWGNEAEDKFNEE